MIEIKNIPINNKKQLKTINKQVLTKLIISKHNK